MSSIILSPGNIAFNFEPKNLVAYYNFIAYNPQQKHPE